MPDANKSATESFYDRIADVHHLAMKLNGYRRSVAKLITSLPLGIDEDSLVLDAGSGTGIITLGFQSSGLRPRSMFALDLSHNSLKVAREQFGKDKETDAGNVKLVQGNILELPFPDETFDLVLTCGVLEYVPLESGLREMARVLKCGAKLVLIPVKPSLVGSVLEFLYKFKTHPVEEVRSVASRHFEIQGSYDFPLTEPIAWSKNVLLLRKPAPSEGALKAER